MDAESLANLGDALNVAGATEAYEGLWREHAEIVRAFLLVATQWRVTPVSAGASSMAGGFSTTRTIFIGLDYGAVKIALDIEGIAPTWELWRGLQVMEIAALAALNEG